MLITKTGPGRRGTLDQGVGTLAVKSSSPEGVRGLLVLTPRSKFNRSPRRISQ